MEEFDDRKEEENVTLRSYRQLWGLPTGTNTALSSHAYLRYSGDVWKLERMYVDN